MDFLDTQIISYKFKGNIDYFAGSIYDKYISSIVALEFLNVFIKGDLNNAGYYPFYNKSMAISDVSYTGRGIFDSKKHSKMGKHRTDVVIVDLNNQYSSFKIYANYAISQLINERNKGGIMMSTQHLEKNQQKLISNQVDFLFDSNLTVVPLNKNIIEQMLLILNEIELEYNIKENYQNSIMDLLIAATSIYSNGNLLTADKELNRVMQKKLNLSLSQLGNNIVTISSINSAHLRGKKVSSESKGYINRGWKYSIINR